MHSSERRGFTLVELLVVVAMIALLIGSVSVSVTDAQERVRIQKATTEVKVIAQAILGYENWDQGGGTYGLPERSDVDADKTSLGFLLGEGGTAQSGGKLPVMLSTALSAGGVIRDPWGTPYKVKIVAKSVSPVVSTASGSMQTGYYLPNFYRLGEGER